MNDDMVIFFQPFITVVTQSWPIKFMACLLVVLVLQKKKKFTTKHHGHNLVHDPDPGDFRTTPHHILWFPATGMLGVFFLPLVYNSDLTDFQANVLF